MEEKLQGLKSGSLLFPVITTANRDPGPTAACGISRSLAESDAASHNHLLGHTLEMMHSLGLLVGGVAPTASHITRS